MLIFAFILYFVAMLGIGVFFFFKGKKSGGDKEYFLGGRKMGPWVTAMSAQASDMSAWLLMGLPGSILAFGLGQAWIGIGLALGTALNWILVAKRLRQFSKASNDSITLPQYLTNRFLSKSKALSIICAVVFLISFTIYVASAFVAGGSVFSSLYPQLDSRTAMLIFAVILIGYTFLGGYRAVCWTDFIQGILMLIALMAIPLIIVLKEKLDFSVLSEVISYQGTQYAFNGSVFSASWRDIVSGLGWGLGYFGMPHIIIRFMSIEKPSMIKKSATVGIVWVLISLFCAIIVAYFGRILVGQELLESGNQKMVFIVLAKKYYPPFIAGLLLSAIIAASMSTADSQLLVASSAFTTDIYKELIDKNASDKKTQGVARIVVLCVAVAAFFIASSRGSGAQAIMDMVENAWGIFGAAFGPVVILSLFWKRFTYKGAVAGIVGGAVTDIAWLVLLSAKTGIYEIIPGFAAGFILAVIFTLTDKQPSDEIKALFDKAVSIED